MPALAISEYDHERRLTRMELRHQNLLQAEQEARFEGNTFMETVWRGKRLALERALRTADLMA